MPQAPLPNSLGYIDMLNDLKKMSKPAPPASATVSSLEMQLLVKEINSGILITATLRAACKVDLENAVYIVKSRGIMTMFCPMCNEITFYADCISPYFGAYKACITCKSLFSKCEKCNTYIHKDDVGNPSHQHIKPTNDPFYTPGQVEPYNADIMGSNRNFYLRTKQEEIIDAHNQLILNPQTKKPGKANLRFFGIELEVEKVTYAPPDMVSRAVNQLGTKFAMVKHDGSIGNHGENGFEVVSVPATLAYHKSGVWDKFFTNLGPFFRTTSPTTGLHIHIALNTLGTVSVGKALYFVNSLENREFIESVSERTIGKANPNGKIYMKVRDVKISDVMKTRQHGPSCPWNQLTKGNTNKYLKKSGLTVQDKFGNPIIENIKSSAVYIRPVCKCTPGLYHLEKYEALRIHTSRPTIELRIFRGVVSKTFLYTALEFADALMDFVQQTSPSNLGYKAFLQWMTMYNSAGRSKLYPNLSRHLTNKGWLDPAKPTPKSWTRSDAPALEKVGFFKT